MSQDACFLMRECVVYGSGGGETIKCVRIRKRESWAEGDIVSIVREVA